MQERRGTPKTTRTKFSHPQFALLIRLYEVNPYPSVVERDVMAAQIGVHPVKVKNWFSNRRAEDRARLGIDKQGVRLQPSKRDAEYHNTLVELGLRQPNEAVAQEAAEAAEVEVEVPKNFTPEQRVLLEESFQRNPLPSRVETRYLARALRVNFGKVRNWFNKNRIRLGKTVPAQGEPEHPREHRSGAPSPEEVPANPPEEVPANPPVVAPVQSPLPAPIPVNPAATSAGTRCARTNRHGMGLYAETNRPSLREPTVLLRCATGTESNHPKC